jgi:hypothetical protein
MGFNFLDHLLNPLHHAGEAEAAIDSLEAVLFGLLVIERNTGAFD